MIRRPSRSTVFPYTTRFRSLKTSHNRIRAFWGDTDGIILPYVTVMLVVIVGVSVLALDGSRYMSLQRSEEHTSELQSRQYLVCRLLLEKKKKQDTLAQCAVV